MPHTIAPAVAPPQTAITRAASHSAPRAPGSTPVVVDPPSALSSNGSLTATIASASDALEQGAFNRLRLYRFAMLSWCLGGVIASIFMPGTWRDRAIAWGSVGVFLTSYLFRRTDAVTAIDRVKRMFPVAIVQSIAAIGVSIGLGVVSPFNSLLVIGLMLYGLSAPRRHSSIVFGLIAGSQAALSLLVLVGVLSGTGLLEPNVLPFGTQLANAVWMQATLATGFLVGRYVRRDTGRLVQELEGAVRDAAHRDALLREAREELARAAKIGGRGAFTGADLGGFRLGTVIGRGGMGEVYAATRPGETIEAAVKLLRRDVLAQEDIVKRFERESRIVQVLSSPNIVRVLAVGGAEAPLPFIAMERLHGEDLVAVLRTRGTLAIEDVATLVREVAAGLRAAHEAGVIHRDLKPANVFHAVHADGARWTILDFGVSKLLRSDEGALTTHEVIGTPHYMAPEQATARRNVDGRTDLYALGVIAYRALTGQLAFARNDLSDVVQAVIHEMPEDPRRARPDLPDDVAAWLRISLAKRPDNRFENADEMAAAFEDARHDRLAPRWREHARQLIAQHAWGTRARMSSRPLSLSPPSSSVPAPAPRRDP